MRNSNTIGVDLAKKVIQVSIATPANKNVRTAWAMLTQGTEYNCKLCLGNAGQAAIGVGAVIVMIHCIGMAVWSQMRTQITCPLASPAKLSVCT
jgi:hypothetical protein